MPSPWLQNGDMFHVEHLSYYTVRLFVYVHYLHVKQWKRVTVMAGGSRNGMPRGWDRHPHTCRS